MIYFTADTHFGSERTLALSRRGFDSVEMMDKDMIEKWNKTIKEDDIVYHLGDFGDMKNVQKLNGKIVLILGNYEEKEMKEKYNNNFAQYRKDLKKYGFAEVVKDGMYIDIKGVGKNIYMTHKPTDCKSDTFNLFGHIHKLCMVKSFGLNVGTDNFNFAPASVEDVAFYKTAIEKYYDNDVFCEKKDLKKHQEMMF